MRRFERLLWVCLLLVIALPGRVSIPAASAQEANVIRYYLAPYGTGYVPRPTMRVCKVVLYQADGGHSAVHAYPVKNWCIAALDTSEAQAQHALAQADPEITLVPLWDGGGEYLPLSATVADLDATSRSQMASYLEARRIPTGWITGDMTIGRVIRYVVQILLTTQRLADDYPELDLDTQVSEIPSAQRQRMLAWMSDNGIETSDIDLSWTVRQVLQRIVDQYGWSGVMELGTSLL